MFGYRNTFTSFRYRKYKNEDSKGKTPLYFRYRKTGSRAIKAKTFIDVRARKLPSPPARRSCGGIGSGCLREDSPSLMICLFQFKPADVRLQKTLYVFLLRKIKTRISKVKPFYISDFGKQSLVYISKNLSKFSCPKNKN